MKFYIILIIIILNINSSISLKNQLKIKNDSRYSIPIDKFGLIEGGIFHFNLTNLNVSILSLQL